MCGIFALLNNLETFPKSHISKCFNYGVNRGPESTKSQISYPGEFLGFHRLAINGLDKASDQPITLDNITLICNGEIYNYTSLYEEMNIIPKTNSDCEVIIHLYKKYGIEETLQLLDGVFAFILVDRRDNLRQRIFIARDPYGVRPLYALYPILNINSRKNDFIKNNHIITDPIIAFSSELKMLNELYNTYINDVPHIISYKGNGYDVVGAQHDFFIGQVKPGTYSELEQSLICGMPWVFLKNEVNYTSPGFSTLELSEKQIFNQIYTSLCAAVKKRVTTTERPIACLLSGGLDSSLITALVKQYYPGELETYSIGLEGSVDLKYAKIVADHLKTKHTEIVVTEDDFFKEIPAVINAIESYDTTTIRASVGNYLIAKYISKNSEAKVIFNGDGSDEVTGGYMYFHEAPDAIEFDKECRRLLQDIYLFDVQRSDRSIASHGLEARTPFLDRHFVQMYLSIPRKLRYHKGRSQCEKYMLRQAFQENSPNLIPKEILWRTKEAFSDGISSHQRSWFSIIEDKLRMEKKTADISFTDPDDFHNRPSSTEQTYYRNLFNKEYPNLARVVPYFWMPRYVNAKDASARTLDIYKHLNK